VVNAIGSFWNLLNVTDALHVLGDRDGLVRLMPLIGFLDRPDFLTTYQTMPQAAAGLIASAAGAWEIAESRFQAALAVCESCGVMLHRGTTREWYADMLMSRNAGDDRARAATLYAEAAENYERLGIRLFADRLAARSPFSRL
jgi:hypothetical protein